MFISSEVIITYGINPFDICSQNPQLWKIIKILFVFTSFISSIIISNFLYVRIFSKIFTFFSAITSNFMNLKSNLDFFYKRFFKKNIKNEVSSLQLLVGQSLNGDEIFLPEKALYQNFLITGSIGSR